MNFGSNRQCTRGGDVLADICSLGAVRNGRRLGLLRTILLMVLGVTLMLSLVGCTKPPAASEDAATGNSGNGKPSVASFKIVSYQGKWEYGRFRIVGELKNTGTVAAGAEIEVIARDSDGVLVDSKQFWPNSINNIPPGGTCGIDFSITEDPAAVTLEAKVVEATVWSQE